MDAPLEKKPAQFVNLIPQKTTSQWTRMIGAAPPRSRPVGHDACGTDGFETARLVKFPYA